MRDYRKFYIGGRWVEPQLANTVEVINPATEKSAGVISLGTQADVDAAVAAARAAFPAYSSTTREERIDLLKAIASEYQRRIGDVAAAISEEMGAPAWLAKGPQAALGAGHLKTAIKILEHFAFEEQKGTTLIAKEPIGVCALITPWNWPINQIACKVVPALAVGCTMVLKPSEIAPFSAQIWTEILDAAGVPAGVFNLLNGDGPTVGAALSRHPDVDLISFTGSTRAGIEVAREAAATVKRVHQELGGKSPNIILPDANLEEAVTRGVRAVMNNSGQTCTAPTRMLVPVALSERVKAIARTAAEAISVGAPDREVTIGPVVSQAQWSKIQSLIQVGIDEGATLVSGGSGRPDDLETGYYVKPTIFADVDPGMTIAREEIFGPVLAIIPYEDEADAIRIANDTPYGLAGYVQSGSIDNARRVMRQIRAGQIHINGSPPDLNAPFGGYKMSGNGREWGEFAFHEFLETKAVIGFEPAP
ncbi:aldehyde dehydrogenase family protein [Rhizorhabdus dicambivorans]|uniref:Aldehyde dehydrogenase family protein n=1 Tax=Rhizorhabdus dicambivorans TaxID=1850238 RepID=A0A2A4FQN6_9SPHN|nr:aldehyde dehydrogenase family protein [Rhizorhabdus dicambivorans]ATE64379.1 aldehyde dehydrogenase family protein [Rhizorhabdus dicambivorans]PCE39711.1 aldehyde dehydrogenase family protein [Rhizorhabdus dicambivorans]